ncbi:unnamed protein product, partial [Thlaspi arvense]
MERRYNELLKQCETMHSSVGTSSLAYVMRKSYRDEASRSLGRVDKNADLVREQQHRSSSEIEVMHPDSVGPSSGSGCNAEI